jgi:hypothetical protein
MHWRSAFSLEEQTRYEDIVKDDQHSYNKPKKAQNCADFLSNGHDDYTTYARTLCTCSYSKV